MLKTLLLATLTCTSLSASANWNMNDVSYLLPLPTSLRDNRLLGLNSKGRGGKLLSRDLVQQLPPLSIEHEDNQIFPTISVVAVRIDSCFPLPVPQACQKQIRLVWQPLEIGPQAQILTIDAAIHTFYELNDVEFSELLSELKNWKNKYHVDTDGLPLGIHPAWRNEKDRSPALLEFQNLISKFAGEKNLIRVTAMALRGGGDMWAFESFEPKDGKLNNLEIPRIKKVVQAFVNQARPKDHFASAILSPFPTGEDTFNNLVRNSEELKSGSDDLLLREMKAIFRIENPKYFNPETTDCASCHLAQPARHWAFKNRADLNFQQILAADIYRNPRHNLGNFSGKTDDSHRLRAFGYYKDEVAISQRVINESADVADTVEAFLQRASAQ